MKRLSKKALCLAAAGLVLAGGASVGSAYAYFTTYTEVSGGAVFNLGQTKTEIDERVDNGTKIVSIRNIGDYACYAPGNRICGKQLHPDLRGAGGLRGNGAMAATATGTTATWFSRARRREP